MCHMSLDNNVAFVAQLQHSSVYAGLCDTLIYLIRHKYKFQLTKRAVQRWVLKLWIHNHCKEEDETSSDVGSRGSSILRFLRFGQKVYYLQEAGQVICLWLTAWQEAPANV